tara:strand:+ start:4330 stop:4539 length:210 start_codon:yes stop_codon:yes gene_type:complete
MTREEIVKIRRELQAAEKALGMQEKAKDRVEKNLTPIGLPDKKNIEPNTGDIPGYIALPKKEKRTENKW